MILSRPGAASESSCNVVKTEKKTITPTSALSKNLCVLHFASSFYLQPWQEACVFLHHQQVRCAGIQNRAGDPTRTGTHLADVCIFQIASLTHYFVCKDEKKN